MLYTRLLTYDGFCGPENETGFFMITNPNRIPMDPMPPDLWITLVKTASSRAQLLDAAADWFKDHFKETFFVEKTPQHCLFYTTIRAAWPNGSIIAIVRHPLDCVASAIRNRDFIPQGLSVGSAARYWTKCASSIQKMTADRRAIIVRYEDLVVSPSYMDEIVAFASGSPRAIQRSRDVSHAFVGRKGFELLTSDITANQVGLWKQDLTDKQIGKIWDISQTVATRFGYAPS